MTSSVPATSLVRPKEAVPLLVSVELTNEVTSINFQSPGVNPVESFTSSGLVRLLGKVKFASDQELSGEP